ncbi:hypothetical protein BWQ96_08221 [Gracilariopsis chorda]|uniref:Uncharacterized protein n=1 Tax=Gracilariopsis chorda TaxID=448386 RepID=A0A2V3IJ43_9FLOR|nr:hypothetical protein BWQ96_08221 [Gracilariopsis chorda]|eukprot:PXF42053.1 hypothetical protein BWQ96_08221 [Gracilariopsis chorda]
MSNSDSEIDTFAAIFALSYTAVIFMGKAKKRRYSQRGGFQLGKKPNATIERQRIDKHYFRQSNSVLPMFSEAVFERRYKMPRTVYKKLSSAVCKADDYFFQTQDALGILGVTADQKITAALLQLLLGMSAVAIVNCVRLKESTNSKSLKRVVYAVVQEFEGK